MPVSEAASASRPSIFIASSTEGLKIAAAVKQQFADFADVDLWTENVFDLNRSYLESLLRRVNLYDFAILCLTADDLLESRGQAQKTPRDNVLFELGLFMGRLGPNRAFVLREEGTWVLSDFQGIKITTFKQPRNEDYSSAVGNASIEIRAAMDKAMEQSEPGFLPSTALALGYFNNFLARVYDALDDQHEITLDGRVQEYDDFALVVLVPNSLRELQASRLNRIVRNLRQVSVKTEFRGFPFYAMGDIDLEKTGRLELFDIPTTLLASEEIIQMLMTRSAVGEGIEEDRLARREIDNFRKTLNYLKKKYSYKNLEIRTLDLGEIRAKRSEKDT
jgi:hypothetical protein